MSYSIKVTSKGGNVTAEYASGTVPEGAFIISGHEDNAYESLGVSRHQLSETVAAGGATTVGPSIMTASVSHTKGS